jgi:hypothetical protein
MINNAQKSHDSDQYNDAYTPLYGLWILLGTIRAPMAHACKPNYSGGRDQEDPDWKPAWASSSTRPYLEKNPSQKRTSEVVQGVGPEFKTRYHNVFMYTYYWAQLLW